MLIKKDRLGRSEIVGDIVEVAPDYIPRMPKKAPISYTRSTTIDPRLADTTKSWATLIGEARKAYKQHLISIRAFTDVINQVTGLNEFTINPMRRVFGIVSAVDDKAMRRISRTLYERGARIRELIRTASAKYPLDDLYQEYQMKFAEILPQPMWDGVYTFAQ